MGEAVQVWKKRAGRSRLVLAETGWQHPQAACCGENEIAGVSAKRIAKSLSTSILVLFVEWPGWRAQLRMRRNEIR